MKKLLISIVSWNTKELLRSCLTSLIEHTDSSCRIVVADNASSDGTPEMIRQDFPSVELIETGANLGFGRAHNMVAESSSEPFVLFLNPDTKLTEPIHTPMLQIFCRHEDVALVGCRMVNLDGTDQPLGIQLPTSPWTEFASGFLSSSIVSEVTKFILPRHNPKESGFVRKLYGGCLMMRRTAAEQVGWFDDRFFMYGEDVDLSRRVESAGYKLFYTADTTLIHLCGGASKKAPGRFSTLMQCESIAKLMIKYYGRAGKVMYVLAVLTRASFRLTLLVLPRLVSQVTKSNSLSAIQGSWAKNVSLLKWCLNQEKPAIPS